MERATRGHLSTKATVFPNCPLSPVQSHEQRLERWSMLLAREPHRLLSTFPGTEFMDPKVRDALCCANSAITVAFEDPVLREAGLSDQSYGTAKKFFGLSDAQMHWILCYCHHGTAIHAGVLTAVVRAVIPKPPRLGFFGWLRDTFAPRAV
jgi:hypothetical protein